MNEVGPWVGGLIGWDVMAKKKIRLDELLVSRGLCANREAARRLIMAGAVLVDDQRWDKPGLRVKEGATLRLKTRGGRFVGRGGEKLAAALKHFPVTVRGRTALDLGASTGGFTDCLLQAGAKKVYAVDVGTNQMAYSLRIDPRVVCLERTHANRLSRDLIADPISLLAVDVSFTRLERVVPYVLPLLSSDADLLLLFKPQFQAPREWVEPGGLMTRSDRLEALLREFSKWLTSADLEEVGRMACPILGGRGNREWFFWVRWRRQDHGRAGGAARS